MNNLTVDTELNKVLSLDSNKEWTLDYLKSKAYAIAALVADGELPPLETYALVRSISEICDFIIKSQPVQTATLDKLNDLGKEERSAFGIEFELRNSPARWDYSSDSEWRDIDEEIKILTEKRRDIEKALQAAYRADRGSITGDGEVSDTTSIQCDHGKQIIAAKFKKG